MYAESPRTERLLQSPNISLHLSIPSIRDRKPKKKKKKKDALDFCTSSYELNKHPIATAVAAVVIDVGLEAS